MPKQKDLPRKGLFLLYLKYAQYAIPYMADCAVQKYGGEKMAKDLTSTKFEGTINGTETKRFLVEAARTGCCNSVFLDTVEDVWHLSKARNIFKDDPKYGIKVRVYFDMKYREKEHKPRLSDNPSVKRFIDQFPTIYLAE